MTTNIRIATVNDAKLMKKCNEVSLPENYPIELWKAVLQNNPKMSRLAMQNEGRIKGYILIVRDQDKPEVAQIFSFAVYAKYRGKGVGRQLLQSALDGLARDHPEVQEVRLNVRPSNPAVHLYKKFGFTTAKTCPGYYEDGEDALEMVGGIASPNSPPAGGDCIPP